MLCTSSGNSNITFVIRYISHKKAKSNKTEYAKTIIIIIVIIINATTTTMVISSSSGENRG